MRYPDRWLYEYEDYKSKYFSGNTGIYDGLNDQQIAVIKSYFKWRTRSRFKQLCKNTSLSAKPKKAEVLSSIMGGAVDWVYDGCVDTGYLGGGHCALGHALRYEHYAYSPSIGRSIVFGVSCAADFFGIEPDRLRKINTVQEEVLEEIKMIMFIRNTGKFKDYIDMYYRNIPEVVAVLNDVRNDTFGQEWDDMMGYFIESSLPFTKTLINRFEWVCKTFYEPRVADAKRIDTLKKLAGTDPYKNKFFKIAQKSNIFLTKTTLDYLYRHVNSKAKNSFEICNRLLTNAVAFEAVCNKLKALGVKSITKFAESCELDIVFVKTANGSERIATKEEKNAMNKACFMKKIQIADDERKSYMLIIGWGFSGDEKLFNKLGDYKKLNDADTKLVESAYLMKDAISWVASESFAQELKRIGGAVNKFQYLDSVPEGEEIADLGSDESLEDMLEYIKYNCPKNSDFWLYKLALDITNKYYKYNINLTDKQKVKIREAYDRLRIDNHEDGLVDINISEKQLDAIEKSNYIIASSENKHTSKLFKQDFFSLALKIANTIKQYPEKEASDKQYNVLEKAVKGIKTFIIEHPLDVTDSTSGSLGENETSKIIDIPDDNSSYNLSDFDDTDINEDSVSNEFNSEQEGVYPEQSEYTTDVTLGFPSIIEISNALGCGSFKESIAEVLKLNTQ